MSNDKIEIKEANFLPATENTWQLGADIHVWKIPAVKSDFLLLSDSEKIIAGRFRFEADRIRFSAGRQSLRFLVSKYMQVNPAGIVISAVAGRKPFITSPPSPIQFNISHSGDWILIVLANGEIGVDLERVNPEFKYRDLLEEHFSEEEQHLITISSDPVSVFYYLWTRKEALTKAWRTGLQENLKFICAVKSDHFAEKNSQKWKIQSFYVTDFYPAAVAYDGRLDQILYFEKSEPR